MCLNSLAPVVIMFFAMTLANCSKEPARGEVVSDSLTSRALDELRKNLQELSMWEKVHAAEYLVWLGYTQGVRDIFLKEEQMHGTEMAYRIGIWRVLVQSAQDELERNKYLDRIREAFRNKAGGDRLHAVETLAKLRVALLEKEPEATEEILHGEKDRLFVYALWGASMDSTRYQREFKKQFIDLITDPKVDDILQLQAAVSLRNLRQLSDSEWEVLAKAALSEPDDSMAAVYMLSAAFVNTTAHLRQTGTSANVYAKLLQYSHSPQKGPRMEVAYALGEAGSIETLDLLTSLLRNEHPLVPGAGANAAALASAANADVRSSAAYGVLRLAERFNSHDASE